MSSKRNRGPDRKHQQCNACQQVVPTNGHGLFMQHECPSVGTDAIGPGYDACPVHGGLVWILGPYSAYRICGGAGTSCQAGAKGKDGSPKPWRYFSRAEYAAGPAPGLPGPVVTKPAITSMPTTITVQPQPSPVTPSPDKPKEPTVPATIVSEPTPVSVAKPLPNGPSPTGTLAKLGSLGDDIMAYVQCEAQAIAAECVADAMSKVAERGPVTINWTVNDAPFATVEGTHHKALPRLLKLYRAGFRNFMIVGPAGSGKTTLAHDLATALKTAFGSVACTAGMSESALTGRSIPNLTTGGTEYQSTEFVRIYEGGGVFLLDENDAADANVMLVINSALSNGHIPLPNRIDAPQATRHADSVVICACNTWGNGSDRQYVGRNQLDAAYLDRFVGATLAVDYDRDMEAALVGDANICATVWAIRDKCAALKLRRIVGTRFLLSVAILHKRAGETLKDAIAACCEGWTADELTKAGVS